MACRSSRPIARFVRVVLPLAALPALVALLPASPALGRQVRDEAAPFQYRVETYRAEEGDAIAFVLRLEQPFLADEFERSTDLSLSALDDNAFLVYPKLTRFEQKHAEFYGRLRGDGTAKVGLSFQVVSEAPDGGRRIEPRTVEIRIAIPDAATGAKAVLADWAREQNAYFASLLESAPDATFFEYVLLQSRERYGVVPPAIHRSSSAQLEKDLYFTFSGGLAVQQALQRDVLESGAAAGDADRHISELSSPEVRSPDYVMLLDRQRERGVKERPHALARFVPEDQYFLHVGSLRTLDELITLSQDWGDSLLRLVTIRAKDHRLREKLAEQMCLPVDPKSDLLRDGVVADAVVTGADMFVAEGADVTLVMRIASKDAYEAVERLAVDSARRARPDLVERDFNYRGQRIAARYTDDRVVSSFSFTSGECVVVSNSHRAIRRIVDTIAGERRSLAVALDYRYVTSILPPRDAASDAYLYASDAFLRTLISPAFKISEKRRLQCFNNLVMLNNASLFHRLEHGRSPASITELVEGRFINPSRLVCPHGGAYAIDAARDTGTCSLHNRLKYLTPNVELDLLQITDDEKAAYQRYAQRYATTWRKYFDPVAVRIDVRDTIELEVAVLPFANGTEYDDLRSALRAEPANLDLGRIARSAVISFAAVPGRESVREFLRDAPGIAGIVASDPTLTDLSFIGDRVSAHLCDGGTIVEVDPARFEPLDLLMKASVPDQAAAAIALAALTLPSYVTIDVVDRERAGRLLDALSSRAFLETSNVFGLPSACDAYRLPDYRGHAIHVAMWRLYALKLRLSVALVGDQIVLATRPETLREVIDAAVDANAERHMSAHALLRFDRRAVRQLEGDLRVYWAEKAREACHRNVLSLYNLARLYGIPLAEVGKLSDAKYGVIDFCPDGGEYAMDESHDQVVCSVHGNRFASRLDVSAHDGSSFARFFDAIDEVVAGLRFEGDDLIATIRIARRER